MEYLVTGGAGFIGSNIVRHLVKAGNRVRVLDNLATGRMENLRDVRDDIEFMEGDLRDIAALHRAMQGVRFVLHTAALPSVPRSVEDPITTNDVNVRGTLNALLAARDAGVGRFVFSSSSSVYGDAPGLPRREDMAPRPASPYAVQKLIGEYYCRVGGSLYGLGTICLRYFNVYGPGQNPESQYAAAIPRFIMALAGGRRPVIYGDGEQTRDFTYVDDVVAANVACCLAPEEALGGVYNIAGGRRVSINELVRTIMRLMGKTGEPVHENARRGDVRDSEGDSSGAYAAFGWQAQVGPEEGLRRTVEYFFPADRRGERHES